MNPHVYVVPRSYGLWYNVHAYYTRPRDSAPLKCGRTTAATTTNITYVHTGGLDRQASSATEGKKEASPDLSAREQRRCCKQQAALPQTATPPLLQKFKGLHATSISICVI